MKQFNTLVLAVLVLLTACKNPLKELNDFKLNINSGALINPSAVLSFVKKGQTGLVTSGLKVSITGMHAEYVYDELGTKDFQLMPDGKIKLIFSPRLVPTAEKPVSLTIRVSGDGIFPFEQDIFLFSREDVQEYQFELESLSSLTPDKRYETKSLSFLGKKKSDTLVFTHTNAMGIEFTYKYPVFGAKFISQEKKLIEVKEQKTFKEPIYKDTVFWKQFGLKDTVINSTAFFFNQQGERFPIDGEVIKVPNWVEVQEKVIERYITVSNTVLRTYERIFENTVPLDDVTANIFSRSTQFYSLTGFIDENGKEVNKPAQFEDCIQFPTVEFTTKSKGEKVFVVYDFGVLNVTGPLISVKLPDNSPVKLYIEGVHFEKSTGQSLDAGIIVPSDLLQIGSSGNVILENNFDIVRRMFFFKNYSTGCGFANVVFDTRTIDLNAFEVWYRITTSKVSLSGSFKGNNGLKVVKVPAFATESFHTASIFVDHPQNRCEGGPVLFSQTKTINSPCNFVGSTFPFLVDYNGSSFLSKYSFYPVELKTRLICKSGSVVTLPDQIISFERQGCTDSRGSFTVRGGQGTFSLIGNSVYKISAVNPNTQQEVSEELPLYTSNTSGVEIEGTVTLPGSSQPQTAYSGKIKFDPENRKFVLTIDFQNKVLNFKIAGCN